MFLFPAFFNTLFAICIEDREDNAPSQSLYAIYILPMLKTIHPWPTDALPLDL